MIARRGLYGAQAQTRPNTPALLTTDANCMSMIEREMIASNFTGLHPLKGGKV